MAKRYWKSLAERESAGQRSAAPEFAGTPLQVEAGRDRRGFLRAAGFTFAGAFLTACRQAPVNKAAPYLVQPEGITPGRATYYASTCAACPAGCGLLVKTRDGRPIKLEGNPDHPLSRGGLCAVGQALILGLYDSLRLKQPQARGKPATWDEVDRALAAEFETIRKNGGAVRFLSGTVASPTVRAAIARFLASFREAKHVEYDALSCSAILDAHEQTHGARLLPRYRFDRAEVIVSFDADFLGTWISPVEFTAGYSAGRRPEAGCFSWHAQIEPRMSLTGTKADRRIIVAPGEIGPMLSELAAGMESGAPGGGVTGELAKRLMDARGRSLVISGVQDVSAQAACNRINHLLGNYGATLDVEHPCYQRTGNDREVENLLRDAAAGKLAAVIVWGANPVYDLPGGEALARVPLVVSLGERMDETAAVAHYVCPDRHPLESWGDAEPASGVVGLRQPVIQPLGDTRPALESLAAWSGAPKPAYETLREQWREQVFPRQSAEKDFEAFWERSVQDGFARVEPRGVKVQPRDLSASAPDREASKAGDFDLVLYAKPGMLDGRHAYNPWLQELPDPVSKVTWDNYACLAPATAQRLGVAQGDVVRIDACGKSLELPVVIQPGQHERVVAVALGYGAKCSERFAKVRPLWLGGRSNVGANGLVGVNAAPLAAFDGGLLRYHCAAAVAKTGKKHDLACAQDHHTLSVPKKLAPSSGRTRPIVQEVALEEIGKLPPPSRGPHLELWPPDHPYTGRRWAMTVDLTACTGCSACVIACQVENNVPVAGKDEVRRSREMHWMRIDRYYSGPPEAPEVAHQPMFCQQCEHAPCETVCPVLATVHSEEGLNQQVYNRCVGTRYCANNCPYKARRFNWFEYAREDKLANMVLNPDVTVRSRGVMEKCTFCVQRIQEAKIEAKREGRRLKDGEIQTACQQSCPAQAIVFGDLNDPKSRVSLLMRSKRRYRVLEETNVRPSAGYLKLVRNRPAGKEDEHRG